MDDPNVYQQLGQLQAKVEALETGQISMHTKLDTLLKRSERSRAVRGALVRVGTVAGGVGAFLAGVCMWAIDHFSSQPPSSP